MGTYTVTMKREQFITIRVKADTEHESMDEANATNQDCLNRLATKESASWGNNFFAVESMQTEK